MSLYHHTVRDAILPRRNISSSRPPSHCSASFPVLTRIPATRAFTRSAVFTSGLYRLPSTTLGSARRTVPGRIPRLHFPLEKRERVHYSILGSCVHSTERKLIACRRSPREGVSALRGTTVRGTDKTPRGQNAHRATKPRSK